MSVSPTPSPFERLRQSYKRGGISSILSTSVNYLRWKLKGSPEEPLEPFEKRLDRLESTAIVMLMREWYATAEPLSRPKVSVILPTRNRPAELNRAVGSVLSQSYENWELVIVNDGAEDLELGTLADDPRVVVIESGEAGVGAARNRGLDHATGDVVTFLDDDNVMDPHWAKSIVLALENQPDADVLVGAQMVSPDPGHPEAPKVRFPARFDWVELTEANYVDMGQLAHRPQSTVRFDESLPAFLDWDYVVRLTMDRTPALVPALSGIYLTGSKGRISYQDRHDLVQEIRSRFETLRSHVNDPVYDSIGHHDARAMTELVKRLREQGDASPWILTLGDSARIRAARKAIARVEGSVMIDTPDEARGHVDLIVVDGSEPIPANLLKPNGLIVGLAADKRDYGSHIETSVDRRVGDQLWVGALTEIDLEALFPGASLVKFGLTSNERSE